MKEQINWKSTIHACYRGLISQAIIVNISPLFFVIFQDKFNLSYTMLASLILYNFVVQIIADIIGTKFTDRLGYRKVVTVAQFFCGIGLVLLGVLPAVMPMPFVGLYIATTFMAFGGGICEVVLSPIVEGVPSESKEASMSLLHAFYCWGQLLVVLATTVILRFIGDDLWFILPVVWAILPFYNIRTFLKVPMHQTLEEHEKTPLKSLFTSKIFIVLLLIMMCAGASELGICQWSSLYFEKALGVDKTLGDLLGPCMFALTMGIGRTIYGIYGHKINLFNALIFSASLCIACYIGTALFPIPILALLSCAFCGLSVSLMWPGTISTGAALYKKGGASMFGIMALFGDIGCSSGPGLLGAVSDFASKNFHIEGMSADTLGLKVGMLTGIIFPIILLISVICLKKYHKNQDIH